MIKKCWNRIAQWTYDKGPLLYILTVVLCAVSTAILLGFVIKQQHQIKHQAIVAKHVAQAIQDERMATLYRQCRDQNRRHHQADKYLEQLLKKSGVRPARRARSQKTIGGFIDALAPKRNCAEYVRRAVPSGTPKPLK